MEIDLQILDLQILEMEIDLQILDLQILKIEIVLTWRKFFGSWQCWDRSNTCVKMIIELKLLIFTDVSMEIMIIVKW